MTGDIYEGQFSQGKRHGNGKYLWTASKDKYDGEYRFGQRCGNGIIYYSNGDKYEGES